MNEFGQWLLEINVTSHYLERLLDKQGVSLLWEQKSQQSQTAIEKQSVPLLPLRDVVVFPHTVIPLFHWKEIFCKCHHSGYGSR